MSENVVQGGYVHGYFIIFYNGILVIEENLEQDDRMPSKKAMFI